MHRMLGLVFQYVVLDVESLTVSYKQTGPPGPSRVKEPYFAGTDWLMLIMRQLELHPEGVVQSLPPRGRWLDTVDSLRTRGCAWTCSLYLDC